MADNNDADIEHSPNENDMNGSGSNSNSSSASSNSNNNETEGNNNGEGTNNGEENNNDISTPVPQPKKIKPRTTRVKPGRLNTDAVDPKFIKTVHDWVSYYERNNVRFGPDGSLQVVDTEGGIKTIPYQKGFDAIRGVTMRSEILRKKSIDFLANLRQANQRKLQILQDAFVEKEMELLEATKTYRESMPRDETVAAKVVDLNQELTDLHTQIQEAKYAFLERVVEVPYERGVIQIGTHDESVIMINQLLNMNLETTAAERTLGLNGDKLPEIQVNNVVDEEEDEEGTNTGSVSSTNSSEGSNTGSASSTNSSEGSNTGSASSTNSSEGSNTGSGSNPYFDELVEELKTKLKTFNVPEGMTSKELKSAIFTQERLVYYQTHIEEFNKQFREAYLKAITEKTPTEEDTA